MSHIGTSVHDQDKAVVTAAQVFRHPQGERTGQVLVDVLEASPCRSIELAQEPSVASPVRDVELRRRAIGVKSGSSSKC